MAYIQHSANRKLLPLYEGKRIGNKLLDPALTQLEAGQLLTITSDGYVTVAGPTDKIVGIAADDIGEVYASTLYPVGGSGKVSYFAFYGEYMTLTYEKNPTIPYNEGTPLYCSPNGKLTTDKVGTAKPVGYVIQAPNTSVAANTPVPQTFRGTMVGARPTDSVNYLAFAFTPSDI